MNAREFILNDYNVISIRQETFDFNNKVTKRLFDILLSLLILTIIMVPMLIIAFAVKLTSRGPVLFRQTRNGKEGKPISVWKFRTMTTMENESVITQAIRNDVRLTPIGGILRRTSLDELPQFFNVLQGHMSIVGPRPHPVAQNEKYRQVIKDYILRYQVKPGITGWAQINGWRGETEKLYKMEIRVAHDLYYIRKWTIWLDIKIVLLTIIRSFTDANAY